MTMHSDKVRIISGYTNEGVSLSFDVAKVICHVETGGEDCNGSPESEVLGICFNEYNDLVIFRGTKQYYIPSFDTHWATPTSCDKNQLADALIALGNKLKETEYEDTERS